MIRFGARSEADEAEDASTFDLGKTASKSEIEAEVRRSGNWTTLFLVLIVGVLSVALVMCIAASVGVYYYVQSLKPPAVEAPKKPVDPPKEIKARIKEVDRNLNTIRLHVGPGKYQTYQITPQTEFLDAAGQPLPQGIASPQLRPLEDVTILPTEDQQALQWLKLRAE